MNAYAIEQAARLKGDGTQTPVKKTSRIVVVPAQAKHVQGVIEVEAAAYAIDLSQDSTGGASSAKQFLSQIEQFPEGQFVAIDLDTNQVVGRTASMRYHFDPSRLLLERWAVSTGDG